MIHKSVMKSLIMAKPVNSRIMIIKIRAVPELDIFSAYAPTAAADESERDSFYNTLSSTVGKGSTTPKIIMGDFNARIRKRQPGEESILGTYTLGDQRTYEAQCANTRDNRERFVTWLMENECYAVNTKFKKQPQKYTKGNFTDEKKKKL